MQDRNFDDLADRFNQRIYNTFKGQLRLDILQADLSFAHQHAPLSIWDAGCGAGQMSLWLANMGHQLTLCDISAKLLIQAKTHFKEAQLQAVFHLQAAQQLANKLPEFDLVLCHALLEWLAEPLPSLQRIASKVRPGGHLSLMFYNRNAMVYQNVLRGGWRLQPIIDDSYIGVGHRLSPPHPQYPHDIKSWLDENGFQVIIHSGIRVFSDYLDQQARATSDETLLLNLEQQYCRLPTYRDMGRYVHMLATKK